MAAPIQVGRFALIEPRKTENKSTLVPKGRSGHCSVADDKNLYVYGGYNPQEGPMLVANGPATYFVPSRQVMAELWKFNFATNCWNKVEHEDIPKAAASASLILKNGKLIAYGGTVFPFGHLMSNTLYVCDMKTFSWERLETKGNSDQLPPRAYGQSTLSHDGYFYTFAGAVSFNSDPVSDLHRLELKTKTWEKLEPTGDIPRGRYKQEVILVENR